LALDRDAEKLAERIGGGRHSVFPFDTI
jgi:hypothetical protein